MGCPTSSSYNKSSILKDSKQFHSYEEIKMAFKKGDDYLDLTDLIITWEFRVDSPDGILIKTLSIGNGLEIVTEPIDSVPVTKLKVESFSLDVPGEIYYDIRMNFPISEKIKYYVGGIVTIKSVVTKQDV